MAVNPNSHIIGVTGGKGGVGKSVFSANLALAFLMEMRLPVLLIDLDPQSCGDQNVILGMREPRTMQELVNFQGALGPNNVQQAVSMHPGTNLGYIAAVRGRDEVLNVPPDTAMKQIEALSHIYRYIIIDLGSNLGNLQMMALERATAVIIVTTPEVLAVNQTARLMTDLLAAGVPTDMMQLVINKASPTGLAPAGISQALRRPIIGAIPQDDVSTNSALKSSVPFMISAAKSPIAQGHTDVVRKLTGGLLTQLKAQTKVTLKLKDAPVAEIGASRHHGRDVPKNVDPRTALKLTLHAELIKAMESKKNLTDTQGDPQKEAELRKYVYAVISKLTDQESPGHQRDDRKMIIDEVVDEALGLGALEGLLDDPTVTEIMVCGHEKIYIEKSGIVQLSPVKFTSNFHLRKVIERIVAPLGRQINESVPLVDARLKDGSRVNAVIEPLAIDGPAVTIRKFRKTPVTPETYVNEFKAATNNMMDFLRLCVENKLNIIISGGTGSGKTTLLNTLSGFIPKNERLVTIEDAAELQLKQDHVVRLETRPPNMEGKGAFTIRDLVKNALRMRPDRVVVGECRDGAALDMLQAMSTGHDGSMTTVHANNPKEAVGRLETLCMMAGMDLPAKAIREQIANAVNVIVQIQRLSDGSRKIIDITEVQGLSGEVVTQQQVFVFKETGFDKNRRITGQFQSTGLMPKFIEKFSRKGVIIPKGMFSNDPPPAAQPAGGAPNSAPAASQAQGQTQNQGTNAQNPATQIKKVVGGGGR